MQGRLQALSNESAEVTAKASFPISLPLIILLLLFLCLFPGLLEDKTLRVRASSYRWVCMLPSPPWAGARGLVRRNLTYTIYQTVYIFTCQGRDENGTFKHVKFAMCPGVGPVSHR